MEKAKILIPLKFDLMFKKVFGNNEDKKPLKYLLECILGITPTKITILNSEILGSSYYDKRTTVDLIVEIDDGTKIGIEMNTNVNKYLINRNLFYMFKIMSKDIKVGEGYDKLNKHIQINFDNEGVHTKPIERYYLMEEEKYNILTDKIEIIRVNIPFYVEKCYNLDAKKLDHKDRFIGFIGADDIKLVNKIKEDDDRMEDLYKRVEEYSDDDEIIGAYDGEWHRKEVERVVNLQAREDGLKEGIEQGIEQGIEITARNMLEKKLDINLISEVTGLSLEELKNLI